MKAGAECLPCALKQALSAARRVTEDRDELHRVLFRAMERLARENLDVSPATVSFYALQEVNEALGTSDPFREEKRRSNEMMLKLYPDLKKLVEFSHDELYTALKIAAAGNIIDMGILHDFDVPRTIERVLRSTFAVDDYEALRRDLKRAKRLVYLADNAGEIVADRLLLEVIGGPEAVVVVKGAPMLNDATAEDAEQVGLGAVARVISNGSGMVGTVLEDCSEAFRNIFERADVIISKGQANYEGLDDLDRPIYFLLTVKCDLVAKALGVRERDTVLKRSGAAPRKESERAKVAGRRKEAR